LRAAGHFRVSPVAIETFIWHGSAPGLIPDPAPSVISSALHIQADLLESEGLRGSPSFQRIHAGCRVLTIESSKDGTP